MLVLFKCLIIILTAGRGGEAKEIIAYVIIYYNI